MAKDNFRVTENTRIGALLTLMEIEEHRGSEQVVLILSADRRWEIWDKQGGKPMLSGTVLSRAAGED